MARKQARRRKAKPARSFSLPTFRWKRLLAPVFALALVVASYQLALHARHPLAYTVDRAVGRDLFGS